VQQNRRYRGKVWCGDKKKIDVEKFLPFTSALTEIV
jgi:hypothetical protein